MIVKCSLNTFGISDSKSLEKVGRQECKPDTCAGRDFERHRRPGIEIFGRGIEKDAIIPGW